MNTEISIFVSYRREDSQHQTDRLCDYLGARFGAGQVFQDVDRMPLGLDFRRVLTEKVAACDVFLAVIGDAWLSVSGSSGSRRLDDPRDFVRIEIEAALKRDIPIIPVLVSNASVPHAEELPESLRELAYRHGIRIRPNPDFRHDVERLIRGIEDVVSALRSGSGARAQQRAEPTAPVEPPKLITNSLGMNLVLIPAGEFLMGSPDSDADARDNEKPQHRVRITRPFYLGATAVTQGQYRAVTGAIPSHFKGSDDLPVEQVSWEDAQAFCAKLNELEKEQLGGARYRLPTEAEWEYACRAGSTTRFCFGDDLARLEEYAWFNGNSDGKTHPAGQKRPNGWGLYDMHGNVWEWCGDGYERTYYANSPGADPLGPSGASARVIRGGSWLYDPRNARSANRSRLAPEDRNNYLGFRLARARVQSGQ
jgi:formylglycine-generating enzyme required for sulfatase activity